MRLALLHAEYWQIEGLAGALEAAGHHVHRYTNPRTLIREAMRESFDLFLLDWVGGDAGALLRELRSGSETECSVIFFNCRNNEGELAEALGSGADDFIIGPVSIREVVARVGAILRRRNPRYFGSTNFLDMPPYRFDMTTKGILVKGSPVVLTDKEFELALFLFRNLGRTLSRGHLLEAVWGSALLAVSRTVDTHVSRIRRKLGLRPEAGFRLSAAYGNGYRLERIVDELSTDAPERRHETSDTRSVPQEVLGLHSP
jgi:two-component system response regulator RegX3